MPVRTRFAPSPTGQVHIGNIRVAIFNWLYARRHVGKFLLRIEDTDAARSTPAAVEKVFEALKWLKMDYDEPPLYQSRRKQAHLEAAELLLKRGHAYRSDKSAPGAGQCVMFKMPGTDISFRDEIRGELRKAASDLPDFVIVRSDGSPVFHLANVVDDIHMGITHVLRGDDHVENTFRHVALFQALDAEIPRYGHFPMIVNRQGKPYSKRDGAAFVGEFSDRGYLPDALFNFLALLGWSPGGDREIMNRAEMIELFDLGRVKSSPAQLDPTKLEWMNSRYIAALPAAEFVRLAREAVSECNWAAGIDERYFERVCALMQSRAALLVAAREWQYFFSEDFTYDKAAVEKNLADETVRAALRALTRELAESEFDEPSVERAIRRAEAAAGMRRGKLNLPVRVAVTGAATGAGLYETIALLGRERTLSRLERALEGCIPGARADAQGRRGEAS